jgi:ribonuclease BN (tRNA processing enzyme)
MPVWGRQFEQVGGMTSCYSLETPDGLIIVDAGSGIQNLTASLDREAAGKPITLLFTHLHLDHIMGLPFCDYLYNSNAGITIMGDGSRNDDWTGHVKQIMDRPYWPVNLEESGAKVEFQNLPSDTNSMTLYGVEISWTHVWHPQTCLAFRFKTPNHDLVIATDIENGDPDMQAAFQEFATGCEYLIYDAQYTPEEYPDYTGWGHSTWEHAVQAAKDCGARKLYLTHHSPRRTDEEINQLVKDASQAFPGTHAAAEGMTLFE